MYRKRSVIERLGLQKSSIFERRSYVQSKRWRVFVVFKGKEKLARNGSKMLREGSGRKRGCSEGNRERPSLVCLRKRGPSSTVWSCLERSVKQMKPNEGRRKQ